MKGGTSSLSPCPRVSAESSADTGLLGSPTLAAGLAGWEWGARVDERDRGLTLNALSATCFPVSPVPMVSTNCAAIEMEFRYVLKHVRTYGHWEGACGCP